MACIRPFTIQLKTSHLFTVIDRNTLIAYGHPSTPFLQPEGLSCFLCSCHCFSLKFPSPITINLVNSYLLLPFPKILWEELVDPFSGSPEHCFLKPFIDHKALFINRLFIVHTSVWEIILGNSQVLQHIMPSRCSMNIS